MMEVEGRRSEEVERGGKGKEEVMLNLARGGVDGRRIRRFGEREEDGVNGTGGERGRC